MYTGIKFEVDITYSFLDTEANVKMFLDRQTDGTIHKTRAAYSNPVIFFYTPLKFNIHLCRHSKFIFITHTLTIRKLHKPKGSFIF